MGAVALAAAVAAAMAGTAAPASAIHAPAGSNADLALMVIPAARLAGGADGAKAVSSGGSGTIDATEQAYRTIDPDDSAADVRKAGFVAGYELGWTWPEGPQLTLTTVVLRFATAAAAAAHMARQVADDRHFMRRPIPPLGLTVESGAVWQPAGLGGLPARGSQGTLSLGGTRWKAGGLTFRSGALVATVTSARSDDGDLRPLLEANARVLRARLAAVAGGSRLDGPPAVRRGFSFGSPNAKPAGAPALDTLAFGPADLPGGGVARAGGWINTPGLIGYDRQVRANVRPFGSGSYATDIEVTLIRHDDLPGAKESYETMVNPAFFGSLIDRTAKLSSARGLKLGRPSVAEVKVGEEGAVLVWQLDTPIGPGRVVVVATRVGRVVEALIATGSTTMLRPDDVVGLLRRVAGRLPAAGGGGA